MYRNHNVPPHQTLAEEVALLNRFNGTWANAACVAHLRWQLREELDAVSEANELEVCPRSLHTFIVIAAIVITIVSIAVSPLARNKRAVDRSTRHLDVA